MPSAPMTYETGLVMGRAFALASAAGPDTRASDELHDLVSGNRAILGAARERFVAFVRRDPDSAGDARALLLVEQALARAAGPAR